MWEGNWKKKQTFFYFHEKWGDRTAEVCSAIRLERLHKTPCHLCPFAVISGLDREDNFKVLLSFFLPSGHDPELKSQQLLKHLLRFYREEQLSLLEV